ncbi:hypothetical protein GW17_00061075 [Ensete ventricosum]|nr:hypothetical protein GW17_00061075 [Ensete ventricosum]
MLRPGATRDRVGEEVSLLCVHRILHRMEVLVISIWRLCTTEEEFRVQVPVSPMRGSLIIQRYDQSNWRVGLLQCSYSIKGAWQVRGQGRFVFPLTKENYSENTEVLK